MGRTGTRGAPVPRAGGARAGRARRARPRRGCSPRSPCCCRRRRRPARASRPAATSAGPAAGAAAPAPAPPAPALPRRPAHLGRRPRRRARGRPRAERPRRRPPAEPPGRSSPRTCVADPQSRPPTSPLAAVTGRHARQPRTSRTRRHLSVPARRAPARAPLPGAPPMWTADDPSHLSCAPCSRCVILGLSAFYAFTQEPRLGLDLRGGTSITLETEDSPTTQADAEATDRALEVLRRRVDALGVSEPTLARSGENRIIVELPGVQDSAAAAEAVGQTAQLTFHPVLGPGDPSQVVGPQPSIAPAPLLTAVPTPDAAAPSAAPSAGATPAPSAQPSAAPSQGRAVPALPGRRPRRRAGADARQREPRRAPHRRRRPTRRRPEVGEDAEFDPSAEQTVVDDSGQPVRLGPASLTGEDVEDAAATVDTQTGTTPLRQHRLQGRGRPQVGAAHRPPPAPSPATRRAASRSCSTARSSARRRSDDACSATSASRAARRDHRRLHAGGGRRARRAHQGRRAARPGRDHRLEHRRPDPRRGGHRRQHPRPASSA